MSRDMASNRVGPQTANNTSIYTALSMESSDSETGGGVRLHEESSEEEVTLDTLIDQSTRTGPKKLPVSWSTSEIASSPVDVGRKLPFSQSGNLEAFVARHDGGESMMRGEEPELQGKSSESSFDGSDEGAPLESFKEFARARTAKRLGLSPEQLQQVCESVVCFRVLVLLLAQRTRGVS